MKRFISILLVAVMLVAMIPAGIFTVSAAEETTPTRPEYTGTWLDKDEEGNFKYITEADMAWYTANPDATVFYVSNGAEFAYMASLLQASATAFKNDKVYLDATIDLGGHYWTPVSMSTSTLSGWDPVAGKEAVQDIQNVTIYHTSTTNAGLGLFYQANYYFQNLNLKDMYIEAAEGSKAWMIGSLVAWGSEVLVLTNVTSDATIIDNSTNSDSKDYKDIGGLLGYTNKETKITSCQFTGSITANNPNTLHVGGLVGELRNHKIRLEGNNVVSGDITVNACQSALSHVGGVVGYFYGYTDKDITASFTGNLTVAASKTCGGLIGDTWYTKAITTSLKNCHVSGNITYNGSDNTTFGGVGGLIGANGCYWYSDKNKSYACNYRIPNITDCSFTGSLIAPKGRMVGGLIGNNAMASTKNTGITMTISNCVVSFKDAYVGEDVMTTDWAGFGGVVGCQLLGFKSANNKVNVTNTYVGGTVRFYGPKTVGDTTVRWAGGMVGFNYGYTYFTDCQFDGVLDNLNGYVAAFAGGSQFNNGVSFTNCVNTGVYINTDYGNKGVTNGRSAMSWTCKNKVEIVNASKGNFSAGNEMLAFDCGNTPEQIQQIVSVETWAALNEVAEGETALWTEVEGSIYPILAIAKDVDAARSNVKSKYDFRWFDLNIAKDKGEMVIRSNDQLRAVNLVYSILDDDTTRADFVNLLVIRENLANNAFSKNLDSAITAAIKADTGFGANVDTESAVFNMDKTFIQTKTDGTAVRFAVLMNMTDVEGVTFDVAFSQVANGTTKCSKFATSETITTAYKAVYDVAKGVDYVAATEGGSEDWVYVVFVVNVNAELLTADTIFTVRATATTANGAVQSTANNYTVDAVVAE